MSLLLLLLLTQILPAALPRLGSTVPLLLAIAVFHWALETPQWLPSPMVFLAGLLHDVISGGPLGLSALLLLILLGLARWLETVLVGKQFGVLWGSFSMLSLVLLTCSWVIAMLYRWTWIDAGPMLIQWMLTMFCYPPITFALTWAQRRSLR